MAINFNNGFPGKTSGEVSAGGVGSFEVGTLVSGTNGFTKVVTSTGPLTDIDGNVQSLGNYLNPLITTATTVQGLIFSVSVSAGTYLVSFRVVAEVGSGGSPLKILMKVGGTQVGPKQRLGPRAGNGFETVAVTSTVPLVITQQTTIDIVVEGDRYSSSISATMPYPVDDYHTMHIIRIA